jgi:hypothetical protein
VARCTCWDFALHLEGGLASNIYRGFLYITRKYGYMIYHEIFDNIYIILIYIYIYNIY